MAIEQPSSAADISDAKPLPRVAVLYPGGRAEKLLQPLEASELEVAVEPDRPEDYDVIMCDQPRYKLAYAVARFRDTPVCYRVRGNIWKEMDIWRFGRSKKFVAENFVYPQLDGAVAVDTRLADIFEGKTGVPTGAAGLAKDLDAWPNATHETPTLNLITLTNMNYRQKIGPLFEYMPVVEEWLADHGGTWYICGKGMHADRVREATADLSHVHFWGYIDPAEYLPQMDAMIHVSNFDAYPNAILEGFASNLPVLTNDFAAFKRDAAPNIVCDSPAEMTDRLARLADPGERARLGELGRRYITESHTMAEIGEQYTEFFTRVAHDSE